MSSAKGYIWTMNVVKSIIQQSPNTEREFIWNHARDLLQGSRAITFDYALGPVQDFSAAKTFSGDRFGRRITSENLLANKKYQGVLFGSSLTWGNYIKDDSIFSNVINTSQSTFGLDNYSFQGKTVEQLYNFWLLNREALDNKDFILVVAGVYDIVKYCFVEPNQSYLQSTQATGLSSMVFSVRKKFGAVKELTYCNTPIERHFIVNRILRNIDDFLERAKKENKSIVFVIPPNPFYTKSNIDSFKVDPEFIQQSNYYKELFEMLDKELQEKNDPRILNMLRLFDSSAKYFIDYGHLNEAGHRKLANDVLNEIRRLFANEGLH